MRSFKNDIKTIRPQLIVAVLILASYALTCTAATIDVTAYGANGNDTNDDTAAINTAVNALTDGDTLLFPQANLYYSVATNVNFNITNKDNIKILIRGKILTVGTPDNGHYVFNLLYADDIEFIGQGSGGIVEGSNEYVYHPDDWNGPSLIKFNVCNRCTVKNLTFRNPPRSSLLLLSCRDISVLDCVFEGGPPTTVDTHQHGILFTGMKDSVIKGNYFKTNPAGGRADSWICSGSTSWNYQISIIDNRFGPNFDHAIYCDLHNSIVSNNTAYDSVGNALKVIGDNNVITNNSVYNGQTGGITILNGLRNIVANNVIDNFTHVAIIVYIYGGGGGVNGIYTDNIIEGNFMLGGPQFTDIWGSHWPYEAIRVWGDDISGTKIINNTIINADLHGATAGIVARGDVGLSTNLTISGNIIDKGSGHGMSLYGISDSLVSDNIINIPIGGSGVYEYGGSGGNAINDNIVTSY